MKKTLLITLVLCLILSGVVLSSCGSSRLPEGKADYINLVDGLRVEDVEFKYINETTVKITRKDGTVIYVPTFNIERICVEK